MFYYPYSHCIEIVRVYIYIHLPKFISSRLVIHGTSQLIYPPARKIKYFMFKVQGYQVTKKPPHPNPTAQLVTSFKTKILLSCQEPRYADGNFSFRKVTVPVQIHPNPQGTTSLPPVPTVKGALRSSQPLKYFITINCRGEKCNCMHHSLLLVWEGWEDLLQSCGDPGLSHATVQPLAASPALRFRSASPEPSWMQAANTANKSKGWANIPFHF